MCRKLFIFSILKIFNNKVFGASAKVLIHRQLKCDFMLSRLYSDSCKGFLPLENLIDLYKVLIYRQLHRRKDGMLYQFIDI